MAAKKATVNCGEAVTIAQAADLFQKLRQAMDTSGTIELVADKVEKVDTAGLQLLITAFREVEKAGGGLSWKKPSDNLIQAAATLGLDAHLSLTQPA